MHKSTDPGACSRCVCVCVCVCVWGGVFTAVCVCTLDGLNAEHKFRVWVNILGHMSLLLKKSNHSLDNKNLKWGKYHHEINVFLKYTLDTTIGTPRNY